LSRPGEKGRRLRAGALVVAFAALVAAGCKDKRAPDRDDPAPGAAAPRGADAAPATGLVYVAVNRGGVVELRGGGFTSVLAAGGRLTDVAVVGEKVYAVADAEILLADGSEGEIVGQRATPGIARRIAAGEGDRLWAVTGKGLWVLESGQWRSDDAFPRPRTVLDVVADRRGRVVAAVRETAYLKDAAGWREVAFPPPPPEPPAASGERIGDSGEDGIEEGGARASRTWVRQLVLGSDGEIYAATSTAVYRLAGDGWTEVAAQPVSALAVASDGTVVAGAESGEVLWGEPGKVVPRRLSDLGLAATHLDAIATDGAGRVWLATDGGLAITDADGKMLARYPPGTLAAVGGQVIAIEVIEPPGVLPPVPAPRAGAVAGRVIGPDGPAAGAGVELCAAPDTMFRGSPCAEAAHRKSATADESGRFTLADVPAGRYGVAVRAEKDWVIDLTIDCCTRLFEEDSLDLGKIVVR
jgi:hypothetical protein